MTKTTLTNEIAGTIQAAITEPKGGGTVTYGKIAEAVIDKLMKLNVLVQPHFEDIDPLDLAPGAPMPSVADSFPNPASETVVIPAAAAAPEVDDDPAEAEQIEDPDILPAGELRESWRRLREMMEATGILSIQVDFSGSGDDGSVNSVEFEPQVNADGIFLRNIEGQIPTNLMGSHDQIPIADFAEGLYWDINSHAGLEGWYNDSGGHGHCTFRVNGRIDLNHHNTYEESTAVPHAFRLPQARRRRTE